MPREKAKVEQAELNVRGCSRLTLGTDLVALEVQPGVVEAGRSLDHHVDINRQLQAGIARAG